MLPKNDEEKGSSFDQTSVALSFPYHRKSSQCGVQEYFIYQKTYQNILQFMLTYRLLLLKEANF